MSAAHDAPVGRRHEKCGAQILTVDRWVITEPTERQWPRNVEVELPYCPTCRKLVDFKEVTHG